MSSLAEALGAAVDAGLRADAAVVAAFAPNPVRLYPLAPPANPTFPYVLLRIDLVGDDTECGEGAEATVSADVFARQGTYAASIQTANAIAHAVRRSLTRALTVTGHVVDDWLFEADRQIGDPDPTTAHRQVQVTYLTSATA